MADLWGLDDLRIVGDIIVGSLLASGLRQAVRLVALKAFMEPAAQWAGQQAYRRVDDATGGRLPDLFHPPAAEP